MSDNVAQPTEEYLQGFEDGYQFILKKLEADSADLKQRFSDGVIDFWFLEDLISSASHRAKLENIHMKLARIASIIEVRK